MILNDIRDYLAEHRCVSLRDLEYRFDVDPAALREMLAIWIRKGSLRRLAEGARCGGCSGCGEIPEAYEWIAGCAKDRIGSVDRCSGVDG